MFPLGLRTEPLILLAICAEELNAPLNVPLNVLAVTEPLAYSEPVNSCLSSWQKKS